MAGSVDFVLSGEVVYVKDGGIRPGYDYGQIRVRVKVPAMYIGQTPVQDHGLFISIRYNSKDLGKPGFEMFKSRLIRGMHVLMRGSIKPRAATERYPATYFIDCHWRGVVISNTFLHALNRVMMDVDVVSWDGHHMVVKYSYNTRGDNPQWKDREFAVSTLQQPTKGPRDKAYIEGRIFGIDPGTKKECVWILGDTVF